MWSNITESDIEKARNIAGCTFCEHKGLECFDNYAYPVFCSNKKILTAALDMANYKNNSEAEKYKQYLYEKTILQALNHKEVETTYKQWCDMKGDKKELWLK